MEKSSQSILTYFNGIEDIELYLFIFLLLFTLWFIRNTFLHYKAEKRKVKHLHRFAKEGEVESQHQLAKRYQKGNAVKKSCNQAAFWYQKAAFSGDEDAREHLKKFLERRKNRRNKNSC